MTTKFRTSVEHASGAVATISSDGASLRLDAAINGMPCISATLGIEWEGELLGPGSEFLGDSHSID